MSRAYISFKTNIPESSADRLTPQVDYIAFETEDGKRLSVGCCGDSDYGVSGSVYFARFKDLETALEDEYGETIDDWCPMIASDLSLLRGANMYEIGIYLPDVVYDNPIVVKEVTVEIVLGDEILTFCKDTVTVMEYGENDLPEIHIRKEVA